MTKVALAVNSMSALLSAGTILLMFWTITHFVKRLIVADDATDVSLPKMIAIFGSGLCGALMYTWSDTFWFSAVEGEVYAFFIVLYRPCRVADSEMGKPCPICHTATDILCLLRM